MVTKNEKNADEMLFEQINDVLEEREVSDRRQQTDPDNPYAADPEKDRRVSDRRNEH